MNYFNHTYFLFILLFLFIFSPPTFSASQPNFSDYIVKNVYTGKSVKVILRSSEERNYRTRLRETINQPINFAGEYVLTTWGCGTACQFGAVVSKKTGHVVFLPDAISCIVCEKDMLNFQKNSRLLSVYGSIPADVEKEDKVYFYEFTGNSFKLISR